MSSCLVSRVSSIYGFCYPKESEEELCKCWFGMKQFAQRHFQSKTINKHETDNVCAEMHENKTKKQCCIVFHCCCSYYQYFQLVVNIISNPSSSCLLTASRNNNHFKCEINVNNDQQVNPFFYFYVFVAENSDLK